jgi:hypothetical protein
MRFFLASNRPNRLPGVPSLLFNRQWTHSFREKIDRGVRLSTNFHLVLLLILVELYLHSLFLPLWCAHENFTSSSVAVRVLKFVSAMNCTLENQQA